MLRKGLFRALFNSRVVLRALRSLAMLWGYSSLEQLAAVQLEYDVSARDLNSIPRIYRPSTSPLGRSGANGPFMQLWIPSSPCGQMDSNGRSLRKRALAAKREFLHQGKLIAPRRILMIDDTHRPPRRQHALLLQEMIEARPTIPVWIAERTIALSDELLSQGTRDGRDVHYYTMEELWNTSRGQAQFASFAQNVLDRRLHFQNDIPRGTFAQFLSNSIDSDELRSQVLDGGKQVRAEMERYQSNPRYAEWLTIVQGLLSRPSLDNLLELYVMRILILRDHTKRQMSLELAPLSTEELEQRDTSQVQSRCEIFMHEEINVPY